VTSDNKLYANFNPLWDDIQRDKTYPARRPLLAHYTSIAALEKIMGSTEIWFSNPLFMNDMDELKFGIQESADAFRGHAAIRSACGTDPRYQLLADAFEGYLHEFSEQHAFDVYVFCLSEHDPDNTDGLLSMWRGYGENGNGAAIVFDTARIPYNEALNFLILSDVIYGSRNQRRAWINTKLAEFASLLTVAKLFDDKLYLAAHALFERIKLFSIFTKDYGFREEKEWRVVYVRQKDEGHKMDHMLHYSIGQRGIEPKFKFVVAPIEGLTPAEFSMETLVEQIILGPSVSTPLAVSSVRRMLEMTNKKALMNKVIASTTPFRP
jgi:hypothetical protein